MKQCPGCEYLVPDGWTECRRCATDLSGAAPAATGLAAPAPATSSDSVTDWAPPPRPPPATASRAFTSPPPASVATDPSAPPSAPAPVGFAGPSPVGFASPAFAETPATGDPGATFGPATWSPDPSPGPIAPAAAANRRGSSKLYGVIALVVAAVAGWWLYGTLTAREVPAAITAYAEGERGVDHRSAAGYSVRMPGEPVEQSMVVPAFGTNLAMDIAIYEDDDLMAGVIVMDLPPGSGLDPQLLLDGGALGAASVAGAEIKAQHDTTHQGHQALDMEVGADGAEMRFRMIFVGRRAYVAMVATPGAGSGTAFDTLAESLVIGSGI